MENFKCFVNTTTTLSEQSWAVLLDCLTEMEFKKGQKVLEEGEVCRAIYFINKGLCRSYYNLDGKEINTAFYFENEFATNLKSLKTESDKRLFDPCHRAPFRRRGPLCLDR